jgi:hypothetical protein
VRLGRVYVPPVEPACSIERSGRLSMTYGLRIARLAPLLVLVAGCNSPPAGMPDAGPMDMGFQLPDGSVRCHTSADCDDHVACTTDSCLPGIMVCAHAADDTVCDDHVFCNGRETCDLLMGCQHAATRQTCDDGDVCTIDRCDEPTKMCVHGPRDLDMDGDQDFNCPPGTDCDDRDPTRSGLMPELCNDSIDNDCDGIVDEGSYPDGAIGTGDGGAPLCLLTPHDSCADPLAITTSGSTLLNLGGARSMFTLSCGFAPRPSRVLSLTLTQAQDVRITASSDLSVATVAMRTTCMDASTETACADNFPAVIRRRALPAGTYFVIVQGSGMTSVDVQLTAPTPAPTNTDCTMPTMVPATGGHFTGNFVDVHDTTGTSCGSGPGLVYQVTLAAESDLAITLSSPDGQQMSWAVQTTCGATGSEVRCVSGAPAVARLHQQPAGTYFIVIQGPTYVAVDYSLTVDVLPPTPRVHGDLCSDPITVTLDTPYMGTLAGAEDDYATTCGFNYPDVVHTFTLAAASDLDITVDGGTAYLNAALRQNCTMEFPELRCDSGSPVAAHVRNVAAGTYFLIVEGARAGAYTVTIHATTPPTVPTPVTGNSGCGGAIVIPQTGGYWSGTTATGATNNYDPTMCGSGPTNMSPDVAFRLDLTARSRVIATTDGSSFDTLLYRFTNSCHSGMETVCNDDAGGHNTSTLSETLDPGTYFYVVDGFDTTLSGPYQFQAIITPAP